MGLINSPPTDKTLLEAVDTITQKNLNLDYGHRAAFATHDAKADKWETFPVAPCHYDIRTRRGDTVDQILSVVVEGPKHRRYQEMLLAGPFRAIADKVAIYPSPNKELAYLHLTQLDQVPAQMVYNYLIATRFSWEFEEVIDKWLPWADAGYDPVLSYLYAADTVLGYFNGHVWFDKSSSWKQILAGDMTAEKISYMASPSSCTPCNSIWGHENGRQRAGLNLEELHEKFGLAKKVEEPEQIKRKRSRKMRLPADPFANEGLWVELPLPPLPVEPAIPFVNEPMHIIDEDDDDDDDIFPMDDDF